MGIKAKRLAIAAAVGGVVYLWLLAHSRCEKCQQRWARIKERFGIGVVRQPPAPDA